MPSDPELIKTDDEMKMTEAKWTNTMYHIIVVDEVKVAEILDSSNKVICTAIVVNDLVDIAKKLSLCQKIEINLEELKTSIQELVKEKAEMDTIIK